MSNPYESPDPDNFEGAFDSRNLPPLEIGNSSFVRQITIVAILMIINGVLTLGMSGFFFFFGAMVNEGQGEFKREFKRELQRQEQMRNRIDRGVKGDESDDFGDEQGGEMDEAQRRQMREVGEQADMVASLMAGFGLVAGALAALAGLLQIVAGIVNLGFKGRTLGLVALFSALAGSLTCYCAPTSIALAIYGLIVYFNSDVARAFELAGQGHSPNAIKAATYRYN
jgi:hypothetical protein